MSKLNSINSFSTYFSIFLNGRVFFFTTKLYDDPLQILKSTC